MNMAMVNIASQSVIKFYKERSLLLTFKMWKLKDREILLGWPKSPYGF